MKLVFRLMIAALLLFSATSQAKPLRVSHKGAPEFVCPMKSHWHVVMSQPGTCALCGMHLKHSKQVTGYKQPKIKQIFACPMASHWHVRSSVPGTCPLCQMKLVNTKKIKGYRHTKKK